MCYTQTVCKFVNTNTQQTEQRGGYKNEYTYTEIFSEYIANSITNPEEDRTARKLLPETYKIMDEVAYEKAKELKRMELTTN